VAAVVVALVLELVAQAAAVLVVTTWVDLEQTAQPTRVVVVVVLVPQMRQETARAERVELELS
jgi:hypothetical protein